MLEGQLIKNHTVNKKAEQIELEENEPAPRISADKKYVELWKVTERRALHEFQPVAQEFFC